MKNSNEMNMEELDSNEMISIRGGGEPRDENLDSMGSDAVYWEV